jgi:hypothetical protein
MNSETTPELFTDPRFQVGSKPRQPLPSPSQPAWGSGTCAVLSISAIGFHVKIQVTFLQFLERLF